MVQPCWLLKASTARQLTKALDIPACFACSHLAGAMAINSPMDDAASFMACKYPCCTMGGLWQGAIWEV